MDTLYTKDFLEYLDKNKPSAFFDIDHTVIFPIRGKRFYTEKDEFQWEFRPEAIDRLREISRSHTIYFVTNQSRYNLVVKKRIEDMLDILAIPALAYVATGRDSYRKPGIGTITSHDILPRGFPVLDDRSFYCGDAAGRPSDFSDDDLWFAINADICFLTPEKIFDEKLDITAPLPPKKKIKPPPLDMSAISDLAHIIERFDGAMLIGLPGSGKSYVSRWISEQCSDINISVSIFNNDLGIEGKIDDRSFYILDNLNLTEELRSKYPSEILSRNIAKIYMDIDPKDCIRGIKYRVSHNGLYVPDIAVYTWNKRKDIPKDLDIVFTRRPVLDTTFPPYLAK